jgi:hypothetical protein
MQCFSIPAVRPLVTFLHSSRELKNFKFGSVDDFFLGGLIQFGEIGTVSGDPDYQIPEFFRILPGLVQGFPGDHIELNMMASKIAKGFDIAGQFLKGLF